MNSLNTFSLPTKAGRGAALLRQFANWPIRAKIVLMFSLGLIGMAAAVSALMFFTANTLFAHQAETALDRQNEIVAGEIDSLSAKAASDLLLARQNAAFDQLYLTGSQAALEAVQRQLVYLQNRFAIDEICVIAASGAEIARCVQGELAGLDELSPNETANPFFAPALALADGEVYRSPAPYLSPDTGRWVVAHVTPIVLPDGAKAGIFHFEIPLEWFAAKVDSNELPGGYSFLMTKDGRLLVHPQIDQFRKAAGIDLANPDQADFPPVAAQGSDEFQQLIKRMQSGQADRGTFGDGQETYEVVYRPVFGDHWIIATVLPQSVIYQPALNLLRQTLIITVPLLLLGVGLMLWYTARLVAPINHLTDVTQQIADGDLSRRVRVDARDEVGRLADTFNRMTMRLRETLKGLEHRTRDLALAAELGQKLSTLRDLDELLAISVESIRERFDLYYAQIYLTDAAGASLIMRAGTGAVGETLKQNGFRLPINAGSINGTAVLEKQPVIVENTATSPIFRPNPLLPNTRSEMAIPLIAGETVLGVLDMQSGRPEALTDDLVPAFQTLAGQLAIAIENANLFAQAEQARLEVVSQARRQTEAGWQNFLNGIERSERVGYMYNDGRIETLSEMAAAPEAGSANGALNVPIVVANVPIGEILLRGEREWTDDDSELVNAIARQVSQQIENLRLLAQAESYRAEAERAARRLTREAWQEQAETMTTDGYTYDLNQVSPLTAEDDPGTAPVFKQPLVIRDEVVGELELMGVSGKTDKAAELAALVAGQLTAHIENLRLTQQTQAALSGTEQRAKELATLNSISEALISQQNLNEALKSVGEQIIRNFEADSGYIALYDEQKKQIEYPCFYADGEAVEVPPATLGQDVISRIIQTRQPLILNRNVAEQMAELGAMNTGDGKEAVKSWVGIPIMAGKAVVGVISIGVLDREEAFTENEVRLLHTVAANLSTAIQNARLFEQTQQRSKEMEILNAVGQKLISVSDLKTLLRVVGDTICRNLGADQGYIGLYDATHDRLEFPFYSVEGEVITAPTTALGTGVNALVIQKRQPLLINREIDRRMMNMGAKTMDFSRRPKVWLGVPILAGQDQDAIGLISIQSRTREDAFDENSTRLLTTIAASLSTAIQNTRLFAETQKRANRETLVNAINQKIQDTTSVRGAMQVAVEELGRAFKARRTVVQLATAKPENGNGDQGAHN